MNGPSADRAGGGRGALDVDGFVHELANPRQNPASVHRRYHRGRRLGAAGRARPSPTTPGRKLTVTATRGSPAPPFTGSVIAPGVGVIGRAFATRRPLLASACGGPGEPGLTFPAGGCLSVPLVARGAALGVVALTGRDGDRPFDEADLSRVRGLAATAALALACERATRARDQLARAVAVDPLTGLLNRGGIDARLREELDRARRHREPVALVAIDIDRFKAVNDALGHPAGDAVLRGLAAIFRRSVRAFDLCARFGGDEFAVVMPRAAAAAACRIAERIRRRVQHFGPEAVPASAARRPRHRQLRGGRVPAAGHHAVRARRTRRPGSVRRQGEGPEPRPTGCGGLNRVVSDAGIRPRVRRLPPPRAGAGADVMLARRP